MGMDSLGMDSLGSYVITNSCELLQIMMIHRGFYVCRLFQLRAWVPGSLIGRPFGCCGAASSGRMAVSKKRSNFGIIESQNS